MHRDDLKYTTCSCQVPEIKEKVKDTTLTISKATGSSFDFIFKVKPEYYLLYCKAFQVMLYVFSSDGTILVPINLWVKLAHWGKFLMITFMLQNKMTSSKALMDLLNDIILCCSTLRRLMMTGLTPASISLPNSSSVLHAVLLSAIINNDFYKLIPWHSLSIQTPYKLRD